MKHENNLDTLLKLALVAETSNSMKDKQVAKMKAGKIVVDMYPAHIVERVQFMNKRKTSNRTVK